MFSIRVQVTKVSSHNRMHNSNNLNVVFNALKLMKKLILCSRHEHVAVKTQSRPHAVTKQHTHSRSKTNGRDLISYCSIINRY
ncbi:hypothetical protein Hanom_Chr12g01084741 [Helianthus anomalus]